MGAPAKGGLAVIGAIFLLLGLFKLFTGGAWIVWIILGVLLGGLSVLFGKKVVS
ncbi:hypothetical protein GCM10023264_29180 [Sphingomonas daechungensis]|uniref:hypothetical protein n=1 Tax=Sphingomonas daechungensis TaxID=1176646 RepID=UPI0031EF2E61